MEIVFVSHVCVSVRLATSTNGRHVFPTNVEPLECRHWRCHRRRCDWLKPKWKWCRPWKALLSAILHRINSTEKRVWERQRSKENKENVKSHKISQSTFIIVWMKNKAISVAPFYALSFPLGIRFMQANDAYPRTIVSNRRKKKKKSENSIHRVQSNSRNIRISHTLDVDYASERLRRLLQ